MVYELSTPAAFLIVSGLTQEPLVGPRADSFPAPKLISAPTFTEKQPHQGRFKPGAANHFEPAGTLPIHMQQEFT